MRLARHLVLVFASLVLLAGCGSGPPVRVFPPQVTVQELRMQANGEWAADLRIRNYSTVPMQFSRLQATLVIGGHEAAKIDLNPAVGVGPGSTETVPYTFTPPPALKTDLQVAVGNGRGARYRISGVITSSEPESEDDFEYESALDPIPGVNGVLR